MLRKYFVVNTLTGSPAFFGRRFWTGKGAVRKAKTSRFSGLMEVRKFERR